MVNCQLAFVCVVGIRPLTHWRQRLPRKLPLQHVDLRNRGIKMPISRLENDGPKAGTYRYVSLPIQFSVGKYSKWSIHLIDIYIFRWNFLLGG